MHAIFLVYPLPLLAALLGAVVGSFLNVVAYRLPLDRSVVHPGSACPGCDTRLGALELVPVLSYCALLGRCQHCRMRISPRYALVELATALLAAALAWVYGPQLTTVALLVLLFGLIALTLIDLDHFWLPDRIVLPGLALGLAVNSFALVTSPLNALLGAALGYGLFWGIATGYSKLRGRDGLGQGDWKLFAALGAWLGASALPGILLTAAVGGSLVGILLLLTRRGQANTAVPFGPFLALGGLLIIFTRGVGLAGHIG